MYKFIDLQTHSYYSDGLLSPKSLVRRAKKQGIKILALTDHDVIDGVKEAICEGKKQGIKVIPGIEFYANFKSQEIHILGLGIDLNNFQLNLTLKKIQRAHRKWVKETISKLKILGFFLNSSDLLLETKSKFVGLGEIVNFLLKNPNNKRKIMKAIKMKKPDLFRIIEKYFMKGGRAYIFPPEKKLNAASVIKLIRKAKGFPVLAHPGQQLTYEKDGIIKALKKQGIKGLEVLSPYHSWRQIEHYQRLAHELKLVITCGSDYHGDLSNNVLIKSQWDYFRVRVSKIYPNLKNYI